MTIVRWRHARMGGLASPAGFEPATRCLEGSRSSPLSYGDLAERQSTHEMTRRTLGGMPRLLRLMRAFTIVAGVITVAIVAYVVMTVLRERAETTRTTARFDPPVWAGQNFIVGCAGGFYARDESTIVLIISAHCGNPGLTLHDPQGQPIGVLGPRAELDTCPEGRFCAPSDILPLVLAPDRIPWGHLNMVDMGAGGYRTMAPGTRPLACADVDEGDHVEVNGREHFRSGKIIAIGPYEHATDTIFPCMIITDIAGFHGDSGAPAMINGLPAGSTSRVISGYLAFTPLAEGLANLGLVLCTTPDCALSPNTAQ